MWTIYKKEIRGFLGSFTGYLVMLVFLMAMGLFLWVFKGFTVFDMGVAGLQVMFDLAPFVLLFLVSAITMRSFSEEKRLGTLETLTTRPINDLGIILAKYFAALTLVVIALIPTLVYVYSIWQLGDPKGNFDSGAMIGSYFGLILLCMAFTAIGLFSSVLAENQLIALILGIVMCFLFYSLFGFIGDLTLFKSFDQSLSWFGLDYHYESISRGVLDTRDLVYFIGFSTVFIWLTKMVFESRKW